VGVAPAIRLKAPLEGETVINDEIQGRVVFQNENLDDLILLRSDGSPTYMLSVVVDDRDAGITHVIRGDDHLNNAARQALIFEALDWPLPAFAHVPLIHGPDGKKLSKRHGALGVEAYRSMGYLPEALRNYLVRLGWSHGDQEIFSTDQLIKLFTLEPIGRAPARLDFEKLASVNAHYIRETDDAKLAALLEQSFAAGWFEDIPAPDFNDVSRERLVRAMPALKDRAKTLLDLNTRAGFLFAERPLDIEPKAAKSLSGDARAHLSALHTALEELDTWDISTLETTVRTYAETRDIGLGKVAQPLRAALTGTTNAPGIAECLFALGREESLARIADQAAITSA
ncbi:MAG: glutamate--tRNA ligase, partial [Hyphomicrobiaceae bacterium]